MGRSCDIVLLTVLGGFVRAEGIMHAGGGLLGRCVRAEGIMHAGGSWRGYVEDHLLSARGAHRVVRQSR